MTKKGEALRVTACHLGAADKRVFRIDRCKASHLDVKCGIIVNKPVRDLPLRRPPHARTEFIVHLTNKEDSNETRTKKEKRSFLFWLEGVDDSCQSYVVQNFIRRVIEPECFPKDYVSFVKKLLALVRQTPSVQCLDIVLTPVEGENRSDDEDDDVIEWKRSIQERIEKERIWRQIQKEKYRYENRDLLNEAFGKDDFEENHISLETPAFYDFNYLPEVTVHDKKHVTFQVRAKSDAHIALSSGYGNTELKTYEIVIGADGNTKSSAHTDGRKKLIERYTPSILDENEGRDFWLSWDRGYLHVGHGSEIGEDIFMSCRIPSKDQHPVNSVSVTTGPTSTGEWHFTERLYRHRHTSITHPRKVILDAILHHAKNQKILHLLSEKFPRALKITDILQEARVHPSTIVAVVAGLKELQRQGCVQEISHNTLMYNPPLWIEPTHEVKYVDNMNEVRLSIEPTVGIITPSIHVKHVMDVMMEGSKTSYICYKVTDKQLPFIFTVGTIGYHTVVSTKIALAPDDQTEDFIHNFIDFFHTVEEILLVGSGGSVPHLTDYRRHARLGDVVVALPDDYRCPWFFKCDKITVNHDSTFSFDTFCQMPNCDALYESIINLKKSQSRASARNNKMWKYLERLQEKQLKYPAHDFAYPGRDRDKIYTVLDGDIYGEPVVVDPPKPVTAADIRHSNKDRPNVLFGAVAEGKFVAHDMVLRKHFAEETDVMAYTQGLSKVIDSLMSTGRSCALVLGISDYLTGKVNKEWEGYAALTASAYVCTLLHSKKA